MEAADINLRDESGGWLPASRRQGVQVVGGGHRGQARQHVAKVGQGVDVTTGTRSDDRVDDGRAVAGLRVADDVPRHAVSSGFDHDRSGEHHVAGDGVVRSVTLGGLSKPGRHTHCAFLNNSNWPASVARG